MLAGFQVHQKPSKSARMGSDKKMLKLGTPIEISTKRQQNQAICGSGLVHACLGSSEEINCPSSNDHNFRSFASVELIFILTAAEFDRLSENLATEIFAHLVAWCCVNCRRFLACFCL